MSLKDQILNHDDLPFEVVTVPEWNGVEVGIRTLSAEERDAFEASIVDPGKKTRNVKNFRARLVVLAAADPKTKERLFTDKDVEALGRKSGLALDRLAKVAQRMSGLTEDDVEEREKN